MLNKLMIGRLGNQMFQYAAMRKIQMQYYPGEQLNLNFNLTYKEGPKNEGFYNQLTGFNLAPHTVDKKVQLSLAQKTMFLRYFIGYKTLKFFSGEDYEYKKRLYEIKLQKRMQQKGLFIFSYGYYKFEKSDAKNKLFAGFYESDKYFDDIRSTLVAEFTPKEPENPKNRNLYKRIRERESVCVSIRRGDFLAPERIKQTYICTPAYFERAISLICKKVKAPQFVVFSDDIEWVKNNITFPEGTLFESGNDSVYEKLRLMYNCKHYIISNSTFSWWAQYLSRNEDNKIVIAPKKWRHGTYDKDIFQDNWIRI